MQIQNRHSIVDSFRGLMAAVINRALADLERSRVTIKSSERVRDEAMAWINSRECETYCLILDVDYTTLRERAVALYRRFLERAEGHEKAPRKPRKRPGQNQSPLAGKPQAV
jgi:hypothetical protein